MTERRIDATYRVGGETREQSMWVDEDASEDEAQAVVDEVMGDVRSWESEPVEDVVWGYTGWVRESDDWSAEPRKERGW